MDEGKEEEGGWGDVERGRGIEEQRSKSCEYSQQYVPQQQQQHGHEYNQA